MSELKSSIWCPTCDTFPCECPRTRTQIIEELKWYRDKCRKPSDPPRLNERAHTYQSLGGFMMRAGRLDSLIKFLEDPTAN